VCFLQINKPSLSVPFPCGATPMNSSPLRTISRRTFVAGTALGVIGTGAISPGVSSAADEPSQFAGDLKIGTFRFDVTPPLGHALCGGWIKPVEAVDDPLEAIGYVLQGHGKPIVVCVIDWTG